MKFPGLAALALQALAAAAPASTGSTHRLYDGLTAFVHNPEGRDFAVSIDVRDLNLFESGPREVLFKVTAPDGRTLVREVVPDDGVTSKAYQQPAAAWDHEAWYYAHCRMQGAAPMFRWSAFSEPDRLATLPSRTITRPVKGGGKGVYRILLMGAIDHVVTLRLDPALPYGVTGNTEWLHVRGDLFRRSFVYVPRGTRGLHVALAEYDEPRSRKVAIRAPDGRALFEGDAAAGFSRRFVEFEAPGRYDDQVLTVEVTPGGGDLLLAVALLRDPAEGKPFRGDPAVAAVLAPDEATARAIRGGAIYHDGQVFWQPFQVRLHDWLGRLAPADFDVDPAKLPQRPGFIPLNGPHWRPPAADTIMHSWPVHRDRRALHLAIRDVVQGLRNIGPGDHVANGPFRNMGYEMSTYSFHWYRPAWRILSESDAPADVKEILRDAFLVVGDRMAFCRGWARVNGNAFAHVPLALRYCHEATGDPLQKALFETYLDRFLKGGWGERVGVGPSGPVQEGFAYAYHYASYVLESWKAPVADFGDERFRAARDRVRTWFSYTLAEEGVAAGAWSSRTHHYPQWAIERDGPFAWKGLPGPDFTEAVNGVNEWFAARRKNYYALTYHGRLTPKWTANTHAGQSGYGGGMLCQLHVPGKGPVLASTLNGSYGEGMDTSLWRKFHLHSVVGHSADGRPLVTADSEHADARLSGATLTSSGEVRESTVGVARAYTFHPESIACEVRLRETGHDPLLGLWVKNPMRGKVREAYEMIPFIAYKPGKSGSKKPEDRTEVRTIGPDGPLTNEPVAARGVVIDRGGFGVTIEFDQFRPVRRGEADTVLIQLASEPTPAGAIALTYRLIPFGP